MEWNAEVIAMLSRFLSFWCSLSVAAIYLSISLSILYYTIDYAAIGDEAGNNCTGCWSQGKKKEGREGGRKEGRKEGRRESVVYEYHMWFVQIAPFFPLAQAGQPSGAESSPWIDR